MGPGLGAFSLWDRPSLTVARDAEAVEGKFGVPPFKNSSSSSKERSAFRIPGPLRVDFATIIPPGERGGKEWLSGQAEGALKTRGFVITGLKSEGPNDKDGGGSVGNGMYKMVQSILSYFWKEV